MSEQMVGEQSRECINPKKAESIKPRHATLKQIWQDALEAPDGLSAACRDSFTQTNASHQEKPLKMAARGRQRKKEPPAKLNNKKTQKNGVTGSRFAKQRFGLPEGFVHRPRLIRSILLEDNVYRLPNGNTYVPCKPSGTLGRLQHLYALVTVEQFQHGARGSTYVRTDGRIFDYSVDDVGSGREMFDTGYTMQDLERTGSYADNFKPEQSTMEKPKSAAQTR
jgi:hypothetical protein